ncbi:hypothetical protein AEQU2_02384 [Aequorivita lipolytica]|nr:hypothetical protein AEQU2_02384 [Aequorivita lipolytica]
MISVEEKDIRNNCKSAYFMIPLTPISPVLTTGKLSL